MFLLDSPAAYVSRVPISLQNGRGFFGKGPPSWLVLKEQQESAPRKKANLNDEVHSLRPQHINFSTCQELVKRLPGA